MTLYANISCALPRDMAGVKPLTRLVFIEAVLYCRENLTDGLIERLILPFIAVDVPNKGRHLNALTDDPRGFLVLDPEGWRIPLDVWREWNPLKSEVDEYRRAEAARKADYRERKRRESQRDNDGTSGPVPSGQSVAVPDTRKQPEPERKPESEPERESKRSSSVLTVVPDPTGPTGDDPFESTITLIVDALEQAWTGRITKPRSWRHAVRKNTIHEDGDLIRRMLTTDPPEQVALFVLGHGTSTAETRAEHPTCPNSCECAGEGYIGTTDDRGVHRLAPCPGRTA